MTDDFRFHSFLASLSDESREEFLTALLQTCLGDGLDPSVARAVRTQFVQILELQITQSKNEHEKDQFQKVLTFCEELEQ